ncbi:16S rRNA (guanine(527)-N(7))-methyltransferase RsmG [Orrella daihaiensis]|uniref:Ribosomal RNA small subunit methyltransferase G n=1 Tax=Orrella daihaiensis TaxID=2782176 RepID=A0ABY4AJS2_9BURK|nr:16S rRNA (guanine(527)-N(7))-methyltransferase RsmG [Orrella daihaiensis]UOD50532.1 16S rRNA (guanine(527)-N(7))-methyltransferase RsmG [Orrella daihaiensis]
MQLQLGLSEKDQTNLIQFLYELEKWNRTYNLTAIRSIDDMLIQHVFDCLAIVPSINAYEECHKTGFDLIADVGSGAGLPAVVLAISRPHSQVISIDTVEKKTAFVQNVANRLGLVNLQVRHDRVEKIKDIKANLVLSRAFASLEQFVDLSSNIVDDSGTMAAMKSKQLESEIQVLGHRSDGWNVHQVDEIRVPEMSAKRYLAWLQRKQDD